jgi:HPt (histidine-containing phosphotransfer) domain-containing protein
MTANAFDEDRRRCLEAGMDGYLSKPIDRRALFEAVLEYARSGGGEPAPGAAAARGAERSRPAPRASRQTGAAHGGAPTSPWGSPVSGEARPPADGAALPVLDERVIAALVSDLSAALMPEVVATFVEEAHERIAAIEQALAAGDGALAGDHGHALKGSAATFGAVTLRDVALAIEQAGRGGDLAALEQHVRGLRSCGEAVLNELQARYGSDAAAS